MTHDTPIRVDHVGIAVESIPEAEPVLAALGCEKLTEESVAERFRWAYYELGNASRLELIEPIEGGNFLTDFLDEHGPGLHHVTLEVADIERVIEGCEAAGLRVLDRTTFEEWTEAFVSPRNATGTLFQLMEYHEGYLEKRPAGREMYIGGERLGAE
jgi:methylmalonyl-CoA/ethylmalonyl-CoA epimerase